jgi:hypothetical protein
MERGFLPGPVPHGTEENRGQFQIRGYLYFCNGHRFQTRVVQISEKHLADDFPDQVADALGSLGNHLEPSPQSTQIIKAKISKAFATEGTEAIEFQNQKNKGQRPTA